MAAETVAVVDAGAGGAHKVSAAEKLKRLPKPSDEEYTAKMEKLTAEIESKNARLLAIKEILDGHFEKKKAGAGSAVTDLRNKRSDLKGRFQAVLGQKAELKVQLEQINKHRDVLRVQAKSAKDKTQYMKPEDIDEKVKKLQHKLEHTSMTLNEEKQVINQIKELEASRKLVHQVSSQLDELSNSSELRESIIERMKAKDAELESIKEQEKALDEAMAAVREKEMAGAPNLPELHAEKKECIEIVKLARQAKSDLFAARKAANDEYYQREREFKKQLYEERKIRNEARNKEYQERQKERKEREEAERGEPYEDELLLCDQLVNFLSGMLPKEAKVEVAEVAVTLAAPGEGMKLLKKKGDDDDLEAMYGLSSKGKGGKKGKKPAEKEAKPSVVNMQFTLDILSAFSKLKVEVPVKNSSLPTTLDAIKVAKEDFLAKRGVEKERRAAAAEASASGKEEEEEEEAAAVGEEGSDEGSAENVKVSLNVNESGSTVEVTLKVPEEADSAANDADAAL